MCHLGTAICNLENVIMIQSSITKYQIHKYKQIFHKCPKFESYSGFTCSVVLLLIQLYKEALVLQVLL
jgi:hypothetical protein